MGVVFVSKAKATQKQLSGKTAARREHHDESATLAAALSPPAIVNDLVPNLRIIRLPIDELQPARRRPRKPGRDHLANVANCIKAVGQVSPIIIASGLGLDLAELLNEGNRSQDNLAGLERPMFKSHRLGNESAHEPEADEQTHCFHNE